MKNLKELPGNHPMCDTSERGQFLIRLTERAYSRYDPTREFKNLNPDVQKHWIQIADAVHQVTMEALGELHS